MLAERRRDLILDIVSDRGSVSVHDLHRRLNVSRETIRRDITRLASENRLRKTHGGALAMEAVEPAFDERMELNIEGKRAIGRTAAALVPDGVTLAIDAGTTTLCLAEALMERRRLTVLTNDVHIAGRLAGRNDNRVLLLGGEFQGAEAATLGPDATRMLASYYPDFAFIGASALTAHPWLMDYSREEAEMQSQMIALSRTGVLLADHTKFGRSAPNRVANLEQVSRIIVDVRPVDKMARALDSLDAELIVAPDESDDTQPGGPKAAVDA